jgi:hypothetical protein
MGVQEETRICEEVRNSHHSGKTPHCSISLSLLHIIMNGTMPARYLLHFLSSLLHALMLPDWHYATQIRERVLCSGQC